MMASDVCFTVGSANFTQIKIKDKVYLLIEINFRMSLKCVLESKVNENYTSATMLKDFLTSASKYKFTSLQFYKFTSLQVYKFTSLLVYKFTSLRVYEFTSLQVYKHKSLKV